MEPPLIRPLLILLSILLSPVVIAAEPVDPVKAWRGQPVYLDFWASWCTPCAESFPWLNRLQAQYGTKLRVVGVNVDARRGDAERFLRRHPAEFALFYDPEGDLAARYELKGMPSAVLLDSEGRVLWQHSGFRTNEVPDYEAAIRSALKR